VLGRPQPVNDNQTYFEFQVEKTVTPVAGGPRVRYPTVLRTGNVEGEVLAQFVVDTLGLADMSTFKVLKSSHDLFTASVRAALPMMRFHPAEVGGRKVKQLVQMPYEFSLSK
jgi:periplasmic protein TonB